MCASSPKTPRHIQTGQHGESLARRFLEQRGYTIVAANWRCSAGEIDLIARQDALWVFVEVRTRHSDSTEAAFMSITPGKREKLVKAVHNYLDAEGLPDAVWRIDLIAVALQQGKTPRIEHVEDALDW